jgi:hypothetical protein
MELTYTYWQDGGWFVGFLNEFPDYETQGKTLNELESMLMSLYEDIASGGIPFIRRQGVLRLSA